jgi:recombinase/recombinase-like zinc beta ribbon protein
MMHELESLRRFFDTLGRPIKFATTGQGDIDLYSPTGIFAMQIKTAVSEHEVAMMRIRQRRAARQRAEQGRPRWRRAFGYVDMGGDCREPDPATAPLVKQAYAALLAGSSLGEIARMLNDAEAYGLNGQPWTASTVSLFLRKARNAGLRDHNGQLVIGEDGKAVRGTWPGLVDESTWRAAQSILSDPRRAHGPKTVRQHLLTGIIFCGKCGHHLSGMQTLKKTIAYRCKRCLGVGVAGAEIEPLLYELVGGRLAMADPVDLLRAEVHDEEQAQADRLRLSELYAEVSQIGIERAKRLLTGEQAKLATDYLQAEITELEARQQDEERLRVFDGIPLGEPEAVEAVKALSADRFRAVVKVLMRPTVMPVGKGSHVFNPDRVKPNWR